MSLLAGCKRWFAVRLSGENPAYQHRRYGIQKTPVPIGRESFYIKCAKSMHYSVFIYSMRIELSTHSIATPVSANTPSHMDAIPN